MSSEPAPEQSIDELGVDTTIFADDIARDDQSLISLLPSHPAQRSSVTVWTFSNDNPNNTNIMSSARTPETLYTIKPDFDSGSRTYTRMFKGEENGEVLGVVEWHDYTPDKVSFKGGNMVRKGTYFSNGGPFALTFRGTADGKKYTWKGVGSGLNPALYAPDSPNKKIPIAQFSRSRLVHSTDPPTHLPAQLYLSPRALEIADEVLFSFLVMEKGRRTKEASEGNRADAIKAGSSMGFGSAGRSIGDGVGPGVGNR